MPTSTSHAEPEPTSLVAVARVLTPVMIPPRHDATLSPLDEKGARHDRLEGRKATVDQDANAMGRLNIVERRVERFLREPPSVRNAAGVIVVATALIVVGAGVLITLVDGDEYPDLETGLWWAL